MRVRYVFPEGNIPTPPYRILESVGGECFQPLAWFSNPGDKIGICGRGRKCGEAKVLFLFRVENVFSFVERELRRFLNVGLFRVGLVIRDSCASPETRLPFFVLGRLALIASPLLLFGY